MPRPSPAPSPRIPSALLWVTLAVGCSAPDLADAPNQGPSPSPAEIEADRQKRQDGDGQGDPPEAGSAPPPTAAVPAPAPAAVPPADGDATAATSAPSPAASSPEDPASTRQDGAPPPKDPVLSTPADQLPEPPFTAWTTRAPLTLVAPGGDRLATLKRLGVRVEVLQLLDERIRVSCTACTGDARSAEGWLQRGAIKAARSHGTGRDPLAAMAVYRAGWAGGRDLPDGATNAAMCALADHGFLIDGDRATWKLGDGLATFRWTGHGWAPDTVRAPSSPPDWTCRTDGRAPQPTGHSPDVPPPPSTPGSP